MGLDVSFKAHSALSAGAELKVNVDRWEQNHRNCEDVTHIFDTNYAFKVPGMEHYASADIYTPDNERVEPTISVRCNKWGRSYKPITDFLKENNIKWSEC